MLHYLACATIAYFLARYLNARFPGLVTAVWSSGVATIAGLVGGSFVVIGGMNVLGMPVDHNALPSAFGQGLLWSAAGAAGGIFHGRQKSSTGEHGTVSAIPAKALFGWGALSIAVVIGVIAMIGSAIPEKMVAPAPRAMPMSEIDQIMKGAPAYQPTGRSAAEEVRTPPPTTQIASPTSPAQLGRTDLDGKPCSEITEFLGECKR